MLSYYRHQNLMNFLYCETLKLSTQPPGKQSIISLKSQQPASQKTAGGRWWDTWFDHDLRCSEIRDEESERGMFIKTSKLLRLAVLFHIFNRLWISEKIKFNRKSLLLIEHLGNLRGSFYWASKTMSRRHHLNEEVHARVCWMFNAHKFWFLYHKKL